MKLIEKLGVGLIGVCLFLSSWWILNNNLMFHTDIARDFDILKEMVETKRPTLLGPRSSLPGWFHGPAWWYVDLPAFIIGNGNPIVVAGWWWCLQVLSIGIVYWVGKKIWGRVEGIMATLIYASATILSVHGFISYEGAIIIFPLFFYCFWRYIKEKRAKWLAGALLLGGFMVQFQIVFGGPILMLVFAYNLTETIKNKNFKIWLSYLILIIPFSTYILFDIRHDYLQSRSLLNFLTAKTEVGGMGVNEFALSRIKDILVNWMGVIANNNKILSGGLTIGLIFSLLKKLKKKKFDLADPVVLFAYLYFGFWIISLIVFRQMEMASFYYVSFLSVIAIIIIGLIREMPKFIWGVWLGLIVIFNIVNGIEDSRNYNQDINFQDQATWQVNYQAAKWIYNNCGQDFGYFVYSSDLYGYPLRYAMSFANKEFKSEVSLNQKKKTTCILMGPNSKENNWSRESWKKEDVKIEKEPIMVMEYKNGIRLEKYELTKKEQEVASNPLMIKDAFFR